MIIAKSMNDNKTVRSSTPVLTHFGSGERNEDNSNGTQLVYTES